MYWFPSKYELGMKMRATSSSASLIGSRISVETDPLPVTKIKKITKNSKILDGRVIL